MVHRSGIANAGRIILNKSLLEALQAFGGRVEAVCYKLTLRITCDDACRLSKLSDETAEECQRLEAKRGAISEALQPGGDAPESRC